MPPADQLEALLARLGIPVDCQWASVEMRRAGPREIAWALSAGRGATQLVAGEVRHSGHDWDWPERWASYEVWLFGRLRSVEEWPPPWPVWVVGNADLPPGLVAAAIQLHLQTATWPGSTVWAERQWHPIYGESAAIRGAEGPGARREDVLHAWRGLQLLSLMSPAHAGGRRRKLRNLSDGQVLGLYAELAETMASEPSGPDFAADLDDRYGLTDDPDHPFDEETLLREIRRRFGSWETFVRLVTKSRNL